MNHRLAEVKLAEAALLADYYGIQRDLDIALAWCKRAQEEAEKVSKDFSLIEVLVTGAIVKYFRCFSSGSRFGLSRGDIESIDSELLKTHDFLKALRDKFVVHPVNPYEESYVTVPITVREGKTIVGRGLSAGHARLLLSEREATELIALIDEVRRCTRPVIEREEQRILALIKDMPIEKVSAWDLHSPGRMRIADVAKSRKRTLTRHRT